MVAKYPKYLLQVVLAWVDLTRLRLHAKPLYYYRWCFTTSTSSSYWCSSSQQLDAVRMRRLSAPNKRGPTPARYSRKDSCASPGRSQSYVHGVDKFGKHWNRNSTAISQAFLRSLVPWNYDKIQSLAQAKFQKSLAQDCCHLEANPSAFLKTWISQTKIK